MAFTATPEPLPAWVALLAPTTDAARWCAQQDAERSRIKHDLEWRERPPVQPPSVERREALRRALSDFQCDDESNYRPVMHMEEAGEIQ